MNSSEGQEALESMVGQMLVAKNWARKSIKSTKLWLRFRLRIFANACRLPMMI